MCRHILIKCQQNIFKLPFYLYIHKLLKKELVVNYNDFTSFIYLYYTFSFIFASIIDRKSKKYLAQDLIKAINSLNASNIVIELKKELKLRIHEKSDIIYKNFDSSLKMLYEILDAYQDSALKRSNYIIRRYEQEITKEHFIVNKSLDIKWNISDTETIDLTSKDFAHCDSYKNWKDNDFNFLAITKSLNDELGNFDIIKKIKILNSKPKCQNHVSLYIRHIEKIPSYIKLKELKKAKCADKAKIVAAYIEFLEDYFERQLTLLQTELSKSLETAIKTL